MFCPEGDRGSIQLRVNRESSVMEGMREDTLLSSKMNGLKRIWRLNGLG